MQFNITHAVCFKIKEEGKIVRTVIKAGGDAKGFAEGPYHGVTGRFRDKLGNEFGKHTGSATVFAADNTNQNISIYLTNDNPPDFISGAEAKPVDGSALPDPVTITLDGIEDGLSGDAIAYVVIPPAP